MSRQLDSKYIPKRSVNMCSHENYTSVHSSSSHNSQKVGRSPNVPLVDECVNKMWLNPYRELFFLAVERKSVRCYNMDKP